MIRDCDNSDAGTYTLVVSCKGVDIYSNELHLKVVTGRFFFHTWTSANPTDVHPKVV